MAVWRRGGVAVAVGLMRLEKHDEREMREK